MDCTPFTFQYTSLSILCFLRLTSRSPICSPAKVMFVRPFLLIWMRESSGSRLRSTESAITGFYERIDAVGEQSERHNA